MRAMITTHVWLHPTKEKKIVEKYKSDPGWTEMSSSLNEIEFVSRSPVDECAAIYLSSREAEGKA